MRVFLVAAGCSIFGVAPAAHASRGSDFSLSLSGEYRSTQFVREWSGFVALGIAFDRFLTPRSGARQLEPADPQTMRVEPRFALGSGADRREQRREDGPRVTRAERRSAVDPRAMRDAPRLSEGPPKKESEPAPSATSSVPPSAASPSTPPPASPLSSKLARGAIRHALKCAGYLDGRTRLFGLASRARSSAVLPELGVRTLRSSGQLLRLAPTVDDPYRYTQAGTSELTFEARLTWHLDRLVFADEEVSLERLQIERDAAERRLIESVLERLEVWQRSMMRSADPNTEPEQREAAELSAISAAVELDVLTDGWFSKAIGESDGSPQPKVADRPESR